MTQATTDTEDPKDKPHRGSVLHGSLINAFFTLLSRFSGLARDLVLVAWLGASSNIMADAYYAAQKFPNLFRRIFAEGAFSSAFVPAYSASLEKDGVEAADKMAHDAMATLAFMTLVLTFVFELFMPDLMRLTAPGFAENPEKLKMAVLFTRITMPYLPCMAIVAHLSGVLNARGRFIASASVSILLNLTTLLFLLPQHSPADSALWGSIGTFVAGIMQACFLFWAVNKTGAHVSLSLIPVFTKQIRGILILAIPGTLAAAATQINVFVSQNLSSSVHGATSWLANADKFYQLPLGLVGVAIGTALLPNLSRAVQVGDKGLAQKTMDDAVVYGMVFSLPAAVALVAIPFFLIDGLYTRGDFHVFDSQQTALCLFHYGWGVPAFVLTRILNPAFFARKDTFGPMKFAMVSVIVNLCLGIGLFHGFAYNGVQILPKMGVPGLAVSVSAAAWVNVFLMVITLAKRGTWTISAKALSQLMLLGLTSAVMALFCAGCDLYRPQIQDYIAHIWPWRHGIKEIAVLSVGMSGVVIYFAMLFILKVLTPSQLKSIFKRKA